MEPLTFKEAIVRQYNLNERSFEKFVLKRTLFFRVRLVRPIVQIVYPEFLFNEHRLIENAGRAIRLTEIQEEIDFYQHKYVVNSLIKEALRFRLSGMKLIRLAHKAFSDAAATNAQSDCASHAQDSPSP